MVERSLKFEAENYPGYKHARTIGNIEGGGGWRGEDREARMFVLREQGWVGSDVKRVGGGDEDDSASVEAI